MEKMNILITRITPKISGAEVYNFYLLPELKKYKTISIHVLSNNYQFINRLQKERINGSQISVLIGEIGTKKQLLQILIVALPYILLFLRDIMKHLSRNKKNIILMQSITEKLLLTPFLRLFSCKVIWLEHGPIFNTTRASLIKWLYILVSKFSNAIFAVSKDTKDDLIKGGIAKNKVLYSYIGINTKKHVFSMQNRASAKKHLCIKNDTIVIGFVGTVGREKGIIRFIDVAEYILTKSNDMLFIIIGDGPLLTVSKKIVHDRHIEQYFRFYGYVNDVSPYLQAMNLLLLPTDHKEGISIALLEAMSVGTIVYTRDIAGNKELIHHGSTGFLYKNFDKKQIGNTLLSIIKNNDLQKTVQKNALGYIHKNFNIERNIKPFYTMFRNI